jgi:hypothetical protein
LRKTQRTGKRTAQIWQNILSPWLKNGYFVDDDDDDDDNVDVVVDDDDNVDIVDDDDDNNDNDDDDDDDLVLNFTLVLTFCRKLINRH